MLWHGRRVGWVKVVIVDSTGEVVGNMQHGKPVVEWKQEERAVLVGC